MAQRSLLFTSAAVLAAVAAILLAAALRLRAQAARRIEQCRERECALILAVDRLAEASRPRPALHAV